MLIQSAPHDNIVPFITMDQPVNRSDHFVRAERNYLHAISVTETAYGAYHGEIGVILIKLAELYRQYGYHEEAIAVEDRIAEIIALYLADQRI